jgi:hypothetical protein
MTHNICQKCPSEAIVIEPVIHHFLCAYVGPTTDFESHQESVICPKCNHALSKTSKDWEPIGFSITCRYCSNQSIASNGAMAS